MMLDRSRDSGAIGDADGIQDERIRVQDVLSAGVWLGALLAVLSESVILFRARDHLRLSFDLVQATSLYIVIYAEFCCVLMLAATAAGWAWHRSKGGALTRGAWHVWYAGAASTVAAWLQILHWRFGSVKSWQAVFVYLWPYAHAEAALLIPVSMLVGGPMVYLIAKGWVRRRGPRIVCACSLVGLCVLGSPIPGLVSSLNADRRARGSGGGAANMAGRAASSRQIQGVVLVVIDTLRADHLSCLGSARVRTPVMDRLAEKGVLFSQAVSHAPWTQPSMGSLLTSHYPSVHGAGAPGKGIASNLPTLAEILSGEGWDTAAFVTNHILSHEFGFDRGFKAYRMMSDSRPVPKGWQGVAHSVRTAWPFGLFRIQRKRTTDSRARHDCIDRVAMQQAASWLRREAIAPFFLWVHLMAVHDFQGFHAVEVTADGSQRPLSPSSSRAVPPESLRTVSSKWTHDRKPSHEDWHVLYDANVVLDDALLTILTDALRDLAILENTLIIVTSDHGEEFGEHGGDGHGHSLYEEQIHVPLIMACPSRLPAGLRIRNQVRLIDVMPTILELTGLSAGRAVSGRSLVELIDGKTGVERVAFSEFATVQGLESVRIPTRKLILRTTDQSIQLYDLANDPGETRNVAERFPSVVAGMQSAYVNLRGEVARHQRVARHSSVQVGDDLKARMEALGYVVGDDGQIRQQ